MNVGIFLKPRRSFDRLDLVVSVDTAVMHLTARWGSPGWHLNRFETEWLWMLEREDPHGILTCSVNLCRIWDQSHLSLLLDQVPEIPERSIETTQYV